MSDNRYYQCAVIDAGTGIPLYADTSDQDKEWIGSQAFYDWWLEYHCSKQLLATCSYVADDGCNELSTETKRIFGYHPDIIVCGSSPLTCANGSCITC